MFTPHQLLHGKAFKRTECTEAKFENMFECMGLESADISTNEVKNSGLFTIPGILKIKTRAKPATKAGKREVFGKLVMVQANEVNELYAQKMKIRSKS